jgi:phospholipid/cholesterol/gamma-HCH transport system substrate-binding protein
MRQTEQQLFGDDGLSAEARRSIATVNALLGDARESLKKVDLMLADAQAIARNTRTATADLDALRAEVELSLRKVSGLVDEINRKWPFARDREITLP